MPYSDAQLETAFASRYVLGLQLWNEDGNNHTSAGSKKFPMLHGQGTLVPPILGEPTPVEDRNRVDVTFDWEWESFDSSGQVVALADGARMWDQVLGWGITPSRTANVAWLAPGAPRKFFMAGGSDAHGDLNYRREGRFLGWGVANDTAIGKPRNLTFVGSDRTSGTNAVGQNQVVEHLASGAFSVTDGPALRMAIDVNGNGIIDDQDIPMGGDFAAPSDVLPMLVEWKSTPEFGAIDSVDLYVGAQTGTQAPRIYATPGHGLGGSGVCDTYEPTGQCVMQDGYVRDPSGRLRFTVAAAEGMSGVRRILLKPSDYRLFDVSCWIDTSDPEAPRKVCNTSHFNYPDRLYTRAMARTVMPLTKRHYAFTNPIWTKATPPPPPPSQPTVSLQELS